jgi:hypothetical protein
MPRCGRSGAAFDRLAGSNLKKKVKVYESFRESQPASYGFPSNLAETEAIF